MEIYCSTLMRQYPIFTLCILGCLKGRSMYSFVVWDSLLSQGCCYFLCSQGQLSLLIIQFEMFMLSCGYTFDFVVWKVLIWRIFSGCFWLPISTNKLLFLVLIVIGCSALNSLPIRKGDKSLQEICLAKLSTINLGNSANSIFKSDSEGFVFYLKKP